MPVRQASAQQISTDGPEAGGRAVRQLSLLASAALVCTLVVFAFMIIASLVAVSQIDAAGLLRETTQVSRAIAAQPGDIDGITLAAIADTLDLDHARLATTRTLGNHEISVGIGGDRVVAWTPHRFGAMTFESVAPARITAGIVFILIVAAIGWRVRVVGHRLDGRRAQAARQAATDALTGLGNRLAFDAALCAGSPVTGRSFLEQKADFFFLGHSLRFVTGLLTVAQLHRRATRRVFAFSVTYNIATAVAGLTGHLSPLVAAVLMPLSSLCTLSLVAWTFRRSAPAVVKQVQAVARVTSVPVNA